MHSVKFKCNKTKYPIERFILFCDRRKGITDLTELIDNLLMGSIYSIVLNYKIFTICFRIYILLYYYSGNEVSVAKYAIHYFNFSQIIKGSVYGAVITL